MTAPQHQRDVGSLPVRVRFKTSNGAPRQERVLRDRFRLGFGDDCDIRLTGAKGPNVVFEVQGERGPLLVATALPPEEFSNYVEVSIDGEPLKQSLTTLHSGARIDVMDKATQRHYQFVLVADRVHPWIRPRNLLIVIAMLSFIGALFGGYLYWSMLGTKTEVRQASDSVRQISKRFTTTANELIDKVQKMSSADAELLSALNELRSLQAATLQDLQRDFASRMGELERRRREDVTERRQSTFDTERQLQQLRSEVSQQMVASFAQLKDLEQRLYESIAERFAAQEPSGTALKRVFADAKSAVLYIRTRYRVRLGEQTQSKELSALGTGFVVASNGLALTAQHVMYPWRYDRELLVLSQLGLAEVIPSSVRWSVWKAGASVLSDSTESESYNDEAAYNSQDGGGDVRLLFAPETKLSSALVPSPVGLVEIPVPLPGATDVAVFQLNPAMSQFDPLSLAAGVPQVEPLDEVLAIGYPYSRLDNGSAWPQAVRGFVRRSGGEFLELDAAVHPGLSGGPLMDSRADVIGMLSATIGSEVYGVAVHAGDLSNVLTLARQRVAQEQRRLTTIGCDPGRTDGAFDQGTWNAYVCEAAQEK